MIKQWGTIGNLSDQSRTVDLPISYTSSSSYIVVGGALSAGTDQGAYDRGAFYIKPNTPSQIIGGGGRGPSQGAQWMTIGY